MVLSRFMPPLGIVICGRSLSTGSRMFQAFIQIARSDQGDGDAGITLSAGGSTPDLKREVVSCRNHRFQLTLRP